MRRKEAKKLVLDALEGIINQDLRGLVDDDTELSELQVDDDDLEELAVELGNELALEFNFVGKTSIGALVDVVAMSDEQ